MALLDRLDAAGGASLVRVTDAAMTVAVAVAVMVLVVLASGVLAIGQFNIVRGAVVGQLRDSTQHAFHDGICARLVLTLLLLLCHGGGSESRRRDAAVRRRRRRRRRRRWRNSRR